ncbi:MAG: fumarylacetoacetate hydrolase family protein [Acidobacteria bacterium]|nr:fumarylacetoacetate hydrolase family protein [Acidobacteriota bacterium]
MHICRFRRKQTDEPARFGVIEGETILPVRGETPFQPIEVDRAHPLASSEVQLLAPCQPSKIVCIGRNYREHAAELGHDAPAEPLIFLKPPSAVIGPEEAIHLPAISQRVDYEGELVAVIGRRAFQIREDESALEYLLGYTCGIDVTARDLQKKDVQFTRAKSFDTFAPLGPVITTDLDPSHLNIETRVNGEVKQRANTELLIFPLDVLLRFITRVMTLLPGDIIYTGTPAGVGPLKAGDVVEVEIGGVGILRNYVV